MAKLRSFRIRIALLSAILAGSALVGFGLISWWLIYDAKVNRLDAELENQLIRVGRPRPLDRWHADEASLRRELGIPTNTPIAVLVIDAEGNVLYGSPQWDAGLETQNLWISRPSSLPFPSPSPGQRPPPPAPRFMTQQTASGRWRIGAVTTPFAQVAIAVSLNAVTQEMAIVRNIFVVAIPGVLLLVAGGAWAIAGSSLSSIQRLTQVVANVTANGLEQRVPIESADLEFIELIQVFNQMLERLERGFKQASRFSGDAAHELKTPLTILQGELERTLQQAEPGSEIQQSLSHLLDEVRRLSEIVRKLLLLSLADAGQMSLHRTKIDLSSLLTEMLEDIELLAPDLEVQAKIAPGLDVWGDRDLLIQVLQNLISNAIKYNLPKGWIQITANRHTQGVSIQVSNASNEIAQSDRDRIFERFYRGDPARTRQVEGLGLGLSLAREIARSHQGDLTLDPPLPGQTCFTLTLFSTTLKHRRTDLGIRRRSPYL
ncbi:HAMP domain-containing protein [Desertifilum sp. FACHB-1129]|uniref:histidine kinase n=1 Tax=Desertifilum tharense IPPAS B-1220 TaxID=1781255 RepID=A0A1E5QK85_9CYAN|nr:MULTISPECIES: ATP-binding protein [Desertifilum]MDA0211088.1 ATP-binding protein [Cyanobacteria bacterium FC1]MBD2314176.1 HAMP domain-containing protein [Desertifilum sp. FACHB-1129]MBD2320141.1 HAMP domain-containing protein [Desertifilum sp. FACHB-866]MBD2330269.1 HAMP domain-containing protein [Desertifilum sp. FACHB-868]OEJ75099.1 two-component sensor histidine kinase [Desertifilum tharense IPPAS B-1220]